MGIFFTSEELTVLAADIFTAANLLKLMTIGIFKTLWTGSWKMEKFMKWGFLFVLHGRVT